MMWWAERGAPWIALSAKATEFLLRRAITPVGALGYMSRLRFVLINFAKK